jgi:prepilin-type N-terminal cleavage/methylation domain-containing protein
MNSPLENREVRLRGLRPAGVSMWSERIQPSAHQPPPGFFGGGGRGLRARRERAGRAGPGPRADVHRYRATASRSERRGRSGSRNTRPSRSDQLGFTLIEVIVALVVSGVVAAAGYGILAGVADGRAAVAREREARIPGPAVRGTLDGWLRAAALWEGSAPFRGRDRRVGPMSLDELSFAVEDGGPLYPGRRRVTLWVERDRTLPLHGLLAEIAPAERRDGERTDTLALAPTAVGLNARYRARVRMKDAWLDGWDSGRTLPDALELSVIPAPELANDPAGDGLPDVLRLPFTVPLRPSPLREEVGDAGG